MIAALLKYFPAVFTTLARMLGIPYVPWKTAVPVGIAPNATWNTTTGAFTLGTALGTTFSGGIWLRFAGVGINGSTGGPAASGIYWCVMSSGTVGQAYALSGDPAGASGFVPYQPAANGAQLATTAGSHVQTTGAVLTLISAPLQGGSIGANGVLASNAQWSMNNNANLKTTQHRLDSTLFSTNTNASMLSLLERATIKNRGVQNRQVTGFNGYGLTYGASGAAAYVYTSRDTSVAFSHILTGQLATATDYIVLESASGEIFPS